MNRSKSKAMLDADVRAINFTEHDELIADGYSLTKASRAWFRQDGRVTIRLVYRLRNPKPFPAFSTIAYTIRG